MIVGVEHEDEIPKGCFWFKDFHEEYRGVNLNLYCYLDGREVIGSSTPHVLIRHSPLFVPLLFGTVFGNVIGNGSGDG